MLNPLRFALALILGIAARVVLAREFACVTGIHMQNLVTRSVADSWRFEQKGGPAWIVLAAQRRGTSAR